MMTIGEKIRQLRQSKNMSCAQFAKLLGLERKQISRIEKNKSSVKSDYVYEICDLFNVTPNELFGFPKQQCENGRKE